MTPRTGICLKSKATFGSLLQASGHLGLTMLVMHIIHTKTKRKTIVFRRKKHVPVLQYTLYKHAEYSAGFNLWERLPAGEFARTGSKGAIQDTYLESAEFHQ